MDQKSPTKVYISIAVDRSSLSDFIGIMDQRRDGLHGSLGEELHAMMYSLLRHRNARIM